MSLSSVLCGACYFNGASKVVSLLVLACRMPELPAAVKALRIGTEFKEVRVFWMFMLTL